METSIPLTAKLADILNRLAAISFALRIANEQGTARTAAARQLDNLRLKMMTLRALREMGGNTEVNRIKLFAAISHVVRIMGEPP